MKIVGYIFGGIIVITLLGLMIIGALSPETSVYLGNEVPKSYVKEMKELHLLKDDETIQYFYSDGFLDIKGGLYFITNKRLVLYCKDWSEPSNIIPYQDILNIKIDRDESFLVDSYIEVESTDGYVYGFPISSEKNRDNLFFEYIKSRVNN